jgi:hypothetical protein
LRSQKVRNPEEFLTACDQALAETLNLVGRRFTSIIDVRKAMVSHKLKSYGDVITFIKNFVSFWIPYVLGDELPPGLQDAPFGILTPQARRFLQIRLKKGLSTRRAISLAALINYSKRLFPRVPKEFVRLKVEAYAEALIRPDPPVFHFRKVLEVAIRKEVERLPPMVADYTTPFAPSVSSCVENPRLSGGLQGHTRQLLKDAISQENASPWRDAALIDLQNAYFLSSRIDLADRLLSTVRPADIPTVVQMSWESILVKLLDDLLNRPEGSEVAVPVGLLEPLKVRIITKMSWQLQLLRPVQKAMHGSLRKVPTYQLTGGVPVDICINQVVGRLKHGERYVSGDYEAATDNLFLWTTRCALSAMFEKMSFKFPDSFWLSEEYEAHLKSLAYDSFEQLVLFPSQDEFKPFHVTRGQMMGNILSFPLLCVINAAATRVALNKGRKFLINGDDVLFRATPVEYRRWKYITSRAGLKFSLGKNYYSRDMAMINSECYVWSKSSDKLERVPVPNVGLLVNSFLLEMNERGIEQTAYDIIPGLWRDFEKTVPSQHLDRAIRFFWKRYRHWLVQFPGPKDGPRAAGCLGVPYPGEEKFTRFKRLWVAAHTNGLFNWMEGRRTDYSRYLTMAQKMIRKDFLLKHFEWSSSSEVGPLVVTNRGPFGSLLPDPYSRDGGLFLGLMAIHRWFVKPDGTKKQSNFFWRRFRRFARLHPKLPIYPYDLESLYSLRTPRFFYQLKDEPFTTESAELLVSQFLGHNL